MLAEEAIIQWYKNAHSSKGQTQFMAQMEKMVEWLENAEEGLYSINLIEPVVPTKDSFNVLNGTIASAILTFNFQ